VALSLRYRNSVITNKRGVENQNVFTLLHQSCDKAGIGVDKLHIAYEAAIFRDPRLHSFREDTKSLDRSNSPTIQDVKVLGKHKKKTFVCGHKFLIEGVFVTQMLVTLKSQFHELCGLRQIAIL
jgi:hypothetical protein